MPIITGTDGNDVLDIDVGSNNNVDLRRGDDRVRLAGAIGAAAGQTLLTLGEGRDTIVLDIMPGDTQVADFTAGDGGDRIVFGDILAQQLIGWDGSENPFARGFLAVQTVGGDLRITIDRDGAAGTAHGARTLLTLQNVSAAALTAYNLGGYPLNGAVPQPVVFNGGEGADQPFASAANDQLNGNGGNDRLWGEGGNDRLDGGDGDDLLDGGRGNDELLGGDGNDTLLGGAGDDMLGGGADNDILNGGAGNDILDGGDGNDTLDGGLIAGSGGTDVLRGGAGNDILANGSELYGEGGEDLFTGVATLANGGDGRDTFRLDSNATINAGAGDDLVELAYRNIGGPQTVTLGAGVDIVTFPRFSLVRNGSSESPAIVTDFQAGAGGDVLALGSLFELLFTNNENLRGDYRGFDYETNPFATGHLVLSQDSEGRAELRITGFPSTQGGFVRLAGVSPESLTAYNLGGWAPDGSAPASLTFQGTAGNDLVSDDGAVGNDILLGFDGNDTLRARLGADRLEGGAGSDDLDGGEGSDLLFGGAGDDILTANNRANDQLFGGDGNDTLSVVAALPLPPFGDATMPGRTIMDGGAGNDNLRFVVGSVVSAADIFGGDGNDRITIFGMREGNLNGGAGDDVIDIVDLAQSQFQNPGPVVLTLGDGRDVVRSTEFGYTITDFQAGEAGDRLDVFRGYTSNPFADGRLRLTQFGNNTLLQTSSGGTLITLQNVRASDLSAYNLGGYDSGQYAPSSVSFEGGEANDVYTSADGNDDLRGNGGDDLLRAAGGNDTVGGGSGDDQLFGGTGTDTAIFSGMRSEYQLSARGDKVEVRGPDGTDVLVGFERLQFADGTVAPPATVFEGQVTRVSTAFGRALAEGGGWESQERYPRMMADVNGDGRADVVGFGEVGTYVALGNAAGGFGAITYASSAFGRAFSEGGGWESQDRYPRMMADVNGDGLADVVGFGEHGTFVALGNTSGGFGAITQVSAAFGRGQAPGGGWESQDRYPRMMADVNGDGRADIVGFGEVGTYVALANADGGFGEIRYAAAAFGRGPSFGGGWEAQDRYPRTMADVNGDGRADIVGFGELGAYVALADAGGGFGEITQVSTAFGRGPGFGGGWESQDRYPRMVADVNGDGLADIVGFGEAGAFYALADGKGGFQEIQLGIDAFGASAGAGGWNSQNGLPRFLADVNGDGRADLVGFGEDGVYVTLADPFEPIVEQSPF